jgi:hypothetical protein
MKIFHDKLIPIMKRQRYDVNDLGVCYGATTLFILLFLLHGNTRPFNQFYFTIHQLAHKKKRTLFSLQALDVYFSCIKITQEPALHLDYLPDEYQSKNQCMTKMINLFLPLVCEKKIHIEALHRFSGCYTLYELRDYFISLQTTLQNMPALQKKSFVLFLESLDHVIGIAYSPRKTFWTFFDINNSTQQKISFNMPKKLATLINKTLSAPLYSTLFTTTLYGSSENTSDLNKLTTDWVSSKSFKQIHTPTKEKLSLKNHHHHDWFLAVIHNEIDTLIDLNYKIDYRTYLDPFYSVWPEIINMTYYTSIDSFLHIAIKKKYSNLVSYLLEKPEINVNHQNSDGASPLIFAIKNGRTEIALALLKHEKTDINLLDNENNHPLNIAIRNQNKTLIRALYEHPRINFNHIKSFEENLLTFAMLVLEENSPTIKKILTQYPHYLDIPISMMKKDLLDYIELIFSDKDDTSKILDIYSNIELLTGESPHDRLITLLPENIAIILDYKNTKQQFQTLSPSRLFAHFSLISTEKKRQMDIKEKLDLEPPKKRFKYY